MILNNIDTLIYEISIGRKVRVKVGGIIRNGFYAAALPNKDKIDVLKRAAIDTKKAVPTALRTSLFGVDPQAVAHSTQNIIDHKFNPKAIIKNASGYLPSTPESVIATDFASNVNKEISLKRIQQNRERTLGDLAYAAA